jgi:deoxyribodipyrimidine photo-lyase
VPNDIRLKSRVVPPERVEPCNRAAIEGDGKYVLYWMTAFRRAGWNFSLERAVELARDLAKPLVVVETLKSGCPWSSDRHHGFVIRGMADNARRFHRSGILYYPHVEHETGSARELVAALARAACVVVTDEFPIRSFREDARAVAAQVQVRLEGVDSNGLLPIRSAPREYPSAYAFRRFLQKALPDFLIQSPSPNPLARLKLPRLDALPKAVRTRWPEIDAKFLAGDWPQLASLPIDHGVKVAETPGGSRAAQARLEKFVEHGLPRYHEDRKQPDCDVASGLSPYLHFGHISAHEVFLAVAGWSGWSPGQISGSTSGKSTGWWGMPEPAEAFLDELITWREIGYNLSARRDDYDRYESLPDWAKATLAKHSSDRREHVYSLAEFEAGRTHDPLWNAAQMQLVREGRMHNYLRMVWGKKILQWTASPQEALDTMIELNNKYALDGQNPNSYSGIFWILGRYDRPWAPQRPIFGTIRYMSSENTARKIRVKEYVRKYSPKLRA